MDRWRKAAMQEFDDLVEKCSPELRRIIGFLETVAQHAGGEVESPTFDGQPASGVTYRRQGKRFCRFDPKHQASHVAVWIPGADRLTLQEAGSVSPRDDGPWATIKDMGGAVRAVPHILRAYDAAAGG
jgi:hypothetical protein